MLLLFLYTAVPIAKDILHADKLMVQSNKSA